MKSPRRFSIVEGASLTTARIMDTFVWVALGACVIGVWVFGYIAMLFAPRDPGHAVTR